MGDLNPKQAKGFIYGFNTGPTQMSYLSSQHRKTRTMPSLKRTSERRRGENPHLKHWENTHQKWWKFPKRFRHLLRLMSLSPQKNHPWDEFGIFTSWIFMEKMKLNGEFIRPRVPWIGS